MKYIAAIVLGSLITILLPKAIKWLSDNQFTAQITKTEVDDPEKLKEVTAVMRQIQYKWKD